MTHIDPRPCCTGKRAYPSPQAAWDFVLRLNRMKPTRRNRAHFEKPDPQVPYLCPCCGLYHCGRPQ